MEKLDFDLQKKILKACFKTYPDACVVKQHLHQKENIDLNTLNDEIAYLIESGLLRSQRKIDSNGTQIILEADGIFITARGIDYLHDGGLGLKINQCLNK